MNDLSAIKGSAILLDRFYNEYKQATGKEPCKGCKGKVDEYYKEMLSLKPMNGEFKLKAGKVIPFKMGGGYTDVTNANVNNVLKTGHKLGAHMIAVSQGYLKHFESLPSDAEAQVAAVKGVAIAETGNSFTDMLSNIKGVGTKSAAKIADDYPDEETLKAAIANGVDLPYAKIVVNALIKHYS